MDLKQLQLNELSDLYETKLKRDFPPAELRPYASLVQLWENGNYDCLVCQDESAPAAYACFAKEDGRLLLDYYAVEPARRGQGTGSRFFSLMREEFARRSAPYVLIEVESVQSAQTSEETTLRQRRIRFYENCGCRMTPVVSNVFGVEYSIMIFPVTTEDPSAQEVLTELSHIYRLLFLPLVHHSEEDFRRVCTAALQQAAN